VEFWIVRFLPALIGTLALPAVYWLGLRLIGKFGGLMSLLLLTFSYWHINFSRIGFRALLMVTLLAWAFAFLVEGFYKMLDIEKQKKVGFGKTKINYLAYFALSGLLIGISLHTYIAVRVTPAVLFAILISGLILFTDRWKGIIKSYLIVGIFALITAFPMLWDFVENPIHFTGRSSSVSVMSSPNFALSLVKTSSLTLASFLFYGDQNWRHNYPYLPIILPIWGAFLIPAFVWGVLKFFSSLLDKLKKGTEKTKEERWKNFGWVFASVW